MLMLVLLVSIPLSWLAISVDNARRQRQAVEAIRHRGGYVEYNDEVDRSGDLPGYREPAGPAWLRRLLGPDFFTGVFGVDLDSHQLGDADLEHLKSLNDLQWLSLRGTRITDAGLEHLQGFTRLRVLNLADTCVTDAGLRNLRGLADLKVLDVSKTRVTDAVLEPLAALPQLGFLYVEGTQITREGTTKLQRTLPRCQVYR